MEMKLAIPKRKRERKNLKTETMKRRKKDERVL
jgi:hypothetical protein